MEKDYKIVDSLETLEEKIVAHADNLVSGSKEVDIDFVIEKMPEIMDKLTKLSPFQKELKLLKGV